VVDGENLRVEPSDAPVGRSASLVHVSRPVHPAVPAAALVEQTSRTVLGVVLIALDGISHVVERASNDEAPSPGLTDPGLAVTTRRVVVGLAFASQRRVLGGLDAAARVVGPSARWLGSNPLLQAVAAPVKRQLDAAYEVGLAEEEQARAVAGRSGEEAVQLAVPVVLGRVDVDTLVDQLLAEVDLGALIDRVLGQIEMKPVIERVMGELDLPELVENVMGQLNLDPIIQQVLSDLDMPALVNEVVGEMQMSSVVMKATGGMADDVLGEVRNRSADGDALVERIIAKVLRRRLGELPPASGFADEGDTP
jgi:hypothetical protein